MRLSRKQIENHNNYVDRKIKNNEVNPEKPDYKYVPYEPKNVYRRQVIENTGLPDKPKHSMDFDMSFLFDNSLLLSIVLVFIALLIVYVFYAHISISDVWNFFKGVFGNP